MTVENRFVKFTSTDIRAKENSRTVEGIAIVFERESVDLGGFTEIIKRTAITQELLDNSDVFAKLNHDSNYILARSKKGQGSLFLDLREDGLHYRFEAPNTTKGDELLEHIRRGEITASSFAFIVANEEGAQRWYKDSDGKTHCEINKIAYLGDVSPVFVPAYEATECSLRSYNAFIRSLEEEQPEEQPEDNNDAPENIADENDGETNENSEQSESNSESNSDDTEADWKREIINELEKIKEEIEKW